MPASRIDAATLLLGEALVRLPGLAGLAVAFTASTLFPAAALLGVAACLSAGELWLTSRRLGGRALCCDGGRWYWEVGDATVDYPRREYLLAADDLAPSFGVLPLELWGAGGAYRPVLWLPLIDRERRRRLAVALRHPGVNTVSLASAARPG